MKCVCIYVEIQMSPSGFSIAIPCKKCVISVAVWAAWALELIRSATTSGRERKQLWCECTFLSIFDSKLFPLRHGSGALSSSACNLVSTLQCYL